MAGLKKLMIVVLVLFSLTGIFSVSGSEYEVGDDERWKVPSDEQFYNKWASRNRFLLDDTIVFKYKKDSVLLVSEDEYGSCNSSHPILFDNKGMTEVKFDRPGSFFFISGISGHCNLGQKMIVKVLGREGTAANQTTADQTATTDQTAAGSPAAASDSAAASGGAISVVPFVLIFFAGLF